MASSMLRPGALYSQFNDFPLIISPSSIGTSMFGDSRLYLLNPTLKCSRNAPILSLIRAQGSADFIPDAKFYKVVAILRNWQIPNVALVLLNIDICNVMLSIVSGMAAQNFLSEWQDGSEIIEIQGTFMPKVKLEIMVIKDQVKDIIDKIIKEARIGENGDGKIFGERGAKAVRIWGGRPYRS